MKKHVYLLKDLDCADCANKIQQELSKNENLKNVTVNFNTLKLIYETDILTKDDVEKIVQSVEPEVTLTEVNEKSVVKKYEFILKDLDCADCANKIQQELSKNESLKNVTVNFNTLKLVYETSNLSKEEVEKIIQSIEPEVTLIENKKAKHTSRNNKINCRFSNCINRNLCTITRRFRNSYTYSWLFNFVI